MRRITVRTQGRRWRALPGATTDRRKREKEGGERARVWAGGSPNRLRPFTPTGESSPSAGEGQGTVASAGAGRIRVKLLRSKGIFGAQAAFCDSSADRRASPEENAPRLFGCGAPPLRFALQSQ